MAGWRHHFPRGRSLACLLAALGYLAASFGVWPSPAFVLSWLGGLRAAGEAAERYPCEDCPCGCTGAAQCWAHCCCHTTEQRLAWALERGVRPPSNAHFTDAQWQAAAEMVSPGSGRTPPALAAIRANLTRGVPMQQHPLVIAAETPAADAARAPGSPTLASALSCKGLAQLLLTTLPPATPPTDAGALMPLPVCRVPRPSRPAAFDSRTLDITPPPPRCIAG